MRIGSKELRRVAAPTPPPPSAPTTEKFFELSADMLCLAGLDGYFKILNQAWSETLGYQDEELLRVPYLEFVHPDDRAATLIEAAKLGKGFKTVNFRNRYRCKDGQYKWLAWTATPVLDNGTIYAAARDITDEVAAEEGGRQVVHDQRARVMAAMGGDGVVPVFQPILSIPGLQVIGFEALSRFHIPPMRPPDQWFDDASAAGLRTRLEIHAIRRAMEQVCNLPADTFLSINASPATLLSEDFSDAVTGLEGERLVVEVTEHATVEVYEPLQKAIDSLRRRGVRLAIDDAGAGFSSLKHIVRLVPEFIKLDLFLIRDINVDPVKRAVVAGMLGVATQIGGRVIGEGVETEEELRVLVDLGVHCAQGFYLALPRPLT
jgi:PAS domain S-box-containing protein